MDFISRKYTVLMGNEPLTLWIKNNQVQSAKFMDKKIQLNLDESAIKLIRDNPTKIVNGNNLTGDESFTKAVSKMMSSKLELAISKNDKKTLSRFARSELVPENMKLDFIAAINRSNGLRGILTRAVHKTNALFQGLAKKIDRFFDKVADRVANKTLDDPYLSNYQLQHVNKAPPLSQADVRQHVDPKLMELAEEFHKQKGLNQRLFDPDRLSDSIILNEFLEKAVSKGYDLKDSKIALYKVDNKSTLEANTELLFEKSGEVSNLQETIKDLQKRLHAHEVKAASKNETLEDFKTLSKNLDQTDRIDLLVENKEYKNLPEEEKQKFEDNHIFKMENVIDRAEELKNIIDVVQSAAPVMQTVIDRTPTVDFYDKSIQEKITQEWKTQQTKNRSNAEPTRDFMNISCVKFNGVSKESLDRWALAAKSNERADAGVIDKFVAASLRNAEALTVIGVLNRLEDGVYKFVDNFAKEAIYNNIDKSIPEIQKANQGIQKEISINKDEIKERVADMSSEQTFKSMLTPGGELDSQKLYEFAQKLQSVAAALHERESPSTAVTRDELARANQGVSKSLSHGVENAR